MVDMGEELPCPDDGKLRPDMFDHCEDTTYPVRVGDKWTGRILVCLRDGTRRFSELRVPLPGVTPKVLTESLRAMERDGLLTRVEHPGVPARVEYSLTPVGRGLLEFMDSACRWNRDNREDVLGARRAWAGRHPA